MRVAAVDIGTNTVRVLIAEVVDGHAVEVERRSRIAGLGRGVDRSGRLGEEGISRVLTALAGYGALIRHHDVVDVRAVATSAARDASNGDSFLDRAGLALGARPEIIAGEAEAALSFRGATSSAATGGPYLVVDPGGGSTEFVYGSAAPEYAISIDIGSRRLTERCLPRSPASPEDVAAAAAEARKLMAAVVLPGAPVTALGVASTPQAVAALSLELPAFDRHAVAGFELTADALDALIERLASLTLDELAGLPSLDPARAPVILGGAVVLREALAVSGADALVVSGGDILDGVALHLADGR